MSHHVRRITNQQAFQALMQELELEGEGQSTPYMDLALPEVIRNCLHHLSLTEGKGIRFSPVYTSKLARAVRRQLDIVWPELRRIGVDSFFVVDPSTNHESDDPIRWHLKKLAQFGDIVNLSEGFWLPAPIRVVPFPNGGHRLVVGGLSTRDLKRQWSDLRVGGYGRLLEETWANTRHEVDLQNYQDWVGWRPDNLLSWTSAQIQRTITEGTLSSSSFDDFEVYVSSWDLRRRSAQPWFPAIGLDTVRKIESVLLCRTRLRPVRYFLGHFNGQVLKREISVSKEHVRWLQLGLRLLHGYEPEASWDGATLSLFPLPPSPVERHLLAYACALSPGSAEFRYYVHPTFKEALSSYLSQVGYQNRNRGGITE